ncbi:MAG TPA: proteasome activator [Acidimicrobiales bacterium]|nr:proteasome activator [Acidimicrobiales bacterium]
MSNPEDPTAGPPRLEVVEPPSEEVAETETVSQPAKLMRIGSMLKQLLDEARAAPLDEKARVRLREIYETSVHELAQGMSSDLQGELASLALPFDSEAPSDAELRVAQAQLVGWLEGLFHGIQATLFAQQMAARNELENMRRPQLARGPDGAERPGTYL